MNTQEILELPIQELADLPPMLLIIDAGNCRHRIAGYDLSEWCEYTFGTVGECLRDFRARLVDVVQMGDHRQARWHGLRKAPGASP